jgi:cytochrome oxidase Cu insertion factor (SCO1/SenC/PrrC family)
MSATETQVRQNNRWQLLALIALFALPPIAAWLFYFNPQWLPEGRTNHGVLIDPPRTMDQFSLQTPDGEPFGWANLREKWSLVVLAEGTCDEACIQRLIKMRQIRRAQGANRQRVERLLILLPDPDGRADIPSLNGLEGTRIALASANRDAVLEQFETARAPLDQSIFIIDPRVDLMMAHDMSQITSKQILEDLEKLLTASQNWFKGEQYGHK